MSHDDVIVSLKNLISSFTVAVFLWKPVRFDKIPEEYGS
jgi:hypothetical protein